MAKYKKVSEQTRKSFMEKLFYYLGKGLTPTVVKTMSKKDPKFADKWSQLQKNRKKTGTYFNGKTLSIVDAAYAPFLMRFTIVEPFCKTGIMEEFSYVEEWRKALIKSPIVKDSLPENFMELFKKNLLKRGAYFAKEFTNKV